MNRLKKTKNNPRPSKKLLGITYRGVSLANLRMTNNGEWSYKFRSRIGHNGEQLHLGTFETPESAALRYNKEAKRFYKEKGAKKRKMWNEL